MRNQTQQHNQQSTFILLPQQDVCSGRLLLKRSTHTSAKKRHDSQHTHKREMAPLVTQETNFFYDHLSFFKDNLRIA